MDSRTARWLGQRTAAPHEHAWERAARLENTLGSRTPVDVYDCTCGARRLAPRGEQPLAAEDWPPDPHGFPLTVLQDHGQLNVSAILALQQQGT